MKVKILLMYNTATAYTSNVLHRSTNLKVMFNKHNISNINC